MARRRGTAVPDGTQLSLSTEYRSQADRLTDRLQARPLGTGSLVPAGTGGGSVPLLQLVLTPPLKGRVPVAAGLGTGTRPIFHGGPVPLVEGGDVLALPAALLGTLPAYVTLSCHQRHVLLPVAITNCRAVYLALRRRKAVVFGVMEWLALVSSFENDRHNPTSLAEWCEQKALLPTFRLTHLEAIGPIKNARPPSCERSPALGRVLRGWGLQLVRVHHGAAVPP